MTKLQLLNIFEALGKLNISGTKFNYSILKNFNLMKDEADALKKTKGKIIEKYAEKEGQNYKLKNVDPKTGIGNYIIKDIKGFEKEIEEFNKILDEKTNFKPYKIKLSDVPEGLSTQEMATIYELIDENEPKEEVKTKK